MEKSYTVYRHICPNGKSYIGITGCAPESRWKNGKGYATQLFGKAVNKYGWENIAHEILFDGLSLEGAYEKEIECIKRYKTKNPKYGYNCDDGGKGCTGRIVTDEYRKKASEIAKNNIWGNPEIKERLLKHLREISDKNKGRKVPQEARQKTAEAHAKPVLQYDKDLNFVRRFSSIADANNFIGTARNNGLIPRACKDKSKSAYGYYWRYEDDPVVDKTEKPKPKPPYNARAVLQFTKDGQFVAEYESLHDAERKTGYSYKAIWNITSGYRKTAFGYVWKYKDQV